MATTARPQKNRKPEPAGARRPNAWNNNRGSGSFSPGPQAARLANNSSPAPGAAPSSAPGAAPQNSGAGPNGAPARAPDAERILQQLAGLTGTTVTVVTRAGPRWEGVVGGTQPEGDVSGLTLKDARDVNVSGAALKDRVFVPSTDLASWTSGPASSRPANGDSFKTDIDISIRGAPRRERELQAWADDSVGLDLGPGGASSSPVATVGHGDDVTFGSGAANSRTWDQFATNEKLFGVKAGFDEDAYTTKIDRSAPDFKERERKAQMLANEIMGAVSHNPHVAEERVVNVVDDSGVNEEDKYGAVVRSANAYVPPAARKGGAPVPKLSVNAPDGSTAIPAVVPASPALAASSAAPAAKSPAPEAAFREFVSNEKQRLALKKQSMVRKDMESRMADLVSFSKSFKLNKPIPDDLVTILAKDEDKQQAIRDKASKDASSTSARTIASASGPVIATAPSVNAVTGAARPAPKAGAMPPSASAKAAVGGKPSGAPAAAAARSGKPVMFIQTIPAFRGSKPSAGPAQPAAGPGQEQPPLSPDSNRLNTNAPSFRPNPKAASFNPVSPSPKGASPNQKPAEPSAPAQPNPFFGTRVLKKGPVVSIRDDFNPFKYNKVAEASAVGAMWPYNGKRFMTMFPPVQGPPAQPAQPPTQASPHMAPPQIVPQPPPPQPYEEDPMAAAARVAGYPVYYPTFYPGAPMMPGMPPPGPGPYMSSPYMQPMHYAPPPMGPNGQPMYAASPQMGQMALPPGAYMTAPPGAYPPPPNGAGPRGSMPPTPMPTHAHPYYHQPSPQMQHAVPYQMMMAPPQGPPGGVPGAMPPHGYDGAPQPMPPVGHA